MVQKKIPANASRSATPRPDHVPWIPVVHSAPITDVCICVDVDDKFLCFWVSEFTDKGELDRVEETPHLNGNGKKKARKAARECS